MTHSPSFFNTFKTIVSVQASVGEPFYLIEPLKAMVHSVVNGGAQGLRLANMEAIAYARQIWPDVPIIGLTKPEPLPDQWKEVVYITPTLSDMITVAEAGAQIVAVDGTERPRPDGSTLAENITEFKAYHPNRLVMGDIDTVDSAQYALAAGCDLLSTTLSGYTQQSQPATAGPDFGLLQALLTLTDRPVILEGRIWHPDEVAQAKALGAHGAVIGSAITRPHDITQRFVRAAR